MKDRKNDGWGIIEVKLLGRENFASVAIATTKMGVEVYLRHLRLNLVRVGVGRTVMKPVSLLDRTDIGLLVVKTIGRRCGTDVPPVIQTSFGSVA